MAKKSASLSFRAIVLGAEAETIRQALEARVQIDKLIEERQRAYERIAALESQVEDLLGEQGSFPFPPPPLPIAGLDPKLDVLSRPAAPVAGRKLRTASDAPAPSSSEASASETPGDSAEAEDAGA